MCYSAQVWGDYHTYVRKFGAQIDINEFVRLYGQRREGLNPKIPKGMDLAFAHPKTPEEKQIQALIKAYNTELIADSEQEMFEQAKRVADAERKLAVKETKAALNDVRVGGNKVKQMKRWIADAKRTELEPGKDNRIWPDWYAPVLIQEGGKMVVRPMRYHCRPAGMDASVDRTKDGRVSGTYNARRDNLTRFWRHQFGFTHGLMLAEQFYEMVEGPDGKAQEIQFNPRTGETMLIACLWSHWTDPAGVEPDLYSFAAITDEPEPEVAAAGHDRTIINIKPEHVEAWLNPDPQDLDALLAIFDDKRHPYYEHRKAA
ncbi:SOS response-associated peptidase family protein [Arenimonas sp. MALMAid1274]|uniref:SOS response-associated peptidase family protein n=1 Tax=Arenimonas sp. MALMAid1274 TaxID=3411630 RepID=UPI003B9E93D2